MRVLVAVEHHFSRRPDGRVYAEGPPGYTFWSRYLEVFDEVLVLARIRDTTEENGEECADGPGVQFAGLPDYRGPWEYIRQLPALKARVQESVRACDVHVLRVPGLVGRLVWFELRRQGNPFALEIVGDPSEALGRGTWPSVFRALFQQVATRNLQTMCRQATAVRYVTQSVLQQLYPAARGAITASFSDVELREGFATPEQLQKRVERIRARQEMRGGVLPAWHLGFIGSFAQHYKGADVLLRAMTECARLGIPVEASLAGDGQYRGEMERLSRKLGLEGRVRFPGFLPYGKAVQEFLDSVDLFVMPSRTEGLPRAMVEAMARGCPCIGSSVGGIPELLPTEDLFPPGDPMALATKIADVTQDPARMARMSERNVEKAREFHPDILDARRREFYLAVRAQAKQ